jgi:Domain of unknown function (DUF4387)/Acyclic terpene utilisation family protein AtuA
MPELIYRVVSACGILGSGFPLASLRKAIQRRVDAIVADAGSMEAGPYYLGTGEPYFDRAAVEADYRHLVEAGLETGAPVIVGSCGMGGGDCGLDAMVDIGRAVFAELRVRDAKVAVIRAEISPDIVLEELREDRLLELGNLPLLSEEAIRASTIVGQMGVHPIMTALDAGAKFIFAGRACDTALFAADMIRRGIDAGVAYHAGRVLSGGALACHPSSSADCQVAEIHADGSAVFCAPAEDRSCTPSSLAAHSLREEVHPHLQFYPEGVLVMDQTVYFARDGRSAGFRHSQFLRTYKPWPLSIKLEGARRIGQSRAYEWSVHHLLRNSAVIKEKLFPITYYRAIGSNWTKLGQEQPDYFDIGSEDHAGIRTDRLLSLIADAAPSSEPAGMQSLEEMALVIRSTNAGPSHLTFDIVFKTAAGYEAALRSNLFFKDNLAGALGVPVEQVIGTYFVDACSAIKISLERTSLAGSPEERDIFAAQQCQRLERLRIPQ